MHIKFYGHKIKIEKGTQQKAHVLFFSHIYPHLYVQVNAIGKPYESVIAHWYVAHIIVILR